MIANYRMVAGLDEVGMGCLAGPVVAVVTVFENDYPPIGGLRDSKKLTPKRRRALFDPIFDSAKDIGLGYGTSEQVDSMGIRGAWNEAIEMAVMSLQVLPDLTYIDGTVPPRKFTMSRSRLGRVIVHPGADGKIWQVSAASIVAKVIRDEWMITLAKEHPGYGFEQHKGYGTKRHINSIERRGLSSLHRRTFCRKIRTRRSSFGGN